MSSRGTVMPGWGSCPPWCAEHVVGPGGGLHRAAVGDVRLTLIGDPAAGRAIYAVRRRAARTPAEMADLAADLTAAADLLRPEHRQRCVRRGEGRRGPDSPLFAPV